jgi:hypothetical protein
MTAQAQTQAYPAKPPEPTTVADLLALTPEAIDRDIQVQLMHIVDCAIIFVTNMGGTVAAKELATAAQHQQRRMDMQQHNREAVSRILAALGMEG